MSRGGRREGCIADLWLLDFVRLTSFSRKEDGPGGRGENTCNIIIGACRFMERMGEFLLWELRARETV